MGQGHFFAAACGRCVRFYPRLGLDCGDILRGRGEGDLLGFAILGVAVGMSCGKKILRVLPKQVFVLSSFFSHSPPTLFLPPPLYPRVTHFFLQAICY